MSIGEILSELREDRGLTQLELAKRLHISNSSISAYETGTRAPNPEILKAFATFYDVTTDYLLGLTSVSLSPAKLSEEFVNGVKYAELLQMLETLLPQQKAAILLMLENMKFYAEVSDKASAGGGKA